MVKKISAELKVIADVELQKAIAQELEDNEDKDIASLLDDDEDERKTNQDDPQS